jgi:hypothetical protein
MGEIGGVLCKLLDGVPDDGTEDEQVPHAGPSWAHTGTFRAHPACLSPHGLFGNF